MNPTASEPLCLRQESYGTSGLAAVATIGRYHGLPTTIASLKRLTGLGRDSLDGVDLVFAASRCGLTALPLEGEFEQLPQLALLAIVTFHDRSLLRRFPRVTRLC